MSPAVIHSRVLLGLTAHAVTVECHIGNGLPSTTIVGLPEGAVRESRDRIRAAITNSGFEFPQGRLVINLAPGHLAKSGSFLDLAMAISILAATQQIRTDHLEKYEFLGELSLFGELRKARGALTCALAAQTAHRMLLVPASNADEAAVAPTSIIGLVASLADTTAILNGTRTAVEFATSYDTSAQASSPFANIIGQHAAKRALTIAACGGHHSLMVGPPGTGKTLLARAFTDLLPPLSKEQALEVAAIYSVAEQNRVDYSRPPFRDPHHSASAPSLLGGGRIPMPGEASLAHHGVLFLDELPHFKPSALNLLREPIETGEAVVARTSYNVRFPCKFQLIAAMNPCPAGQHCRSDACRCSTAQVQRYQSRISGPMLDRIDLHVSVPPIPQRLLATSQEADDSIGRSEVTACHTRQRRRQQKLNGALNPQEIQAEVRRSIDTKKLQNVMEKKQFSARSFHKIWRVARTVADIDESTHVRGEHLGEALSYRALDWQRKVG